ncbi:hypothetical protein [Pseudomonas sp. NPDC089406]|uniref:hypothetical protein n=1 Tax=Pseudomonas sp. NPDC089406 TaxID=3364463 RepID=UPI00384AC149
MKLLRNNRRLLFTGAALAVLLTVANHWISYYTTPFKLDTGMSGVIYAGQYVKTSKWVFDCNNGRLISRTPLPPPLAALRKIKPPIESLMIHSLNSVDRAVATQLINTLHPDDYENLRYRFSAQNDDSVVWQHNYYLIKHHAGRDWVIEIKQFSWSKSDSFLAEAIPYDAAQYVDHPKALSAAVVSCPAPQ